MRDALDAVVTLRLARSSLRTAALVALIGTIAACGGDGARARADSTPADSADDMPAAGVPAAELDESARSLVAFLQGDAPFDPARLADSITLVVSPEGGGARATFARGQLRQPSSWVVRSAGQLRSFAPPRGLPQVTTAVGRHLNCTEQPLASRAPDLASLPHVGVSLRPDGSASCLQTWNGTFVFDRSARPPRLVAMVYDQWEF